MAKRPAKLAHPRNQTPAAPRLLHAGHLNTHSPWHMDSHLHVEQHEFIVILRGQIQVRFPDATLLGHAGQVLFYRQTEPHEERSVGPVPLETIFLGIAGPLPEPRPWSRLVHDRAGRFAALAHWAWELINLPTHNNDPLLQTLPQLILHTYDSLHQTPESALIHQVKQFIQDHLAEPLYVEQLAQIACLSKYHFSRTFRRAAGMSPMRYVQHARIQAARTLLASSPMPLRAIAPLVGFSDEADLSRTFYRVLGIRPSELRGRSDAGVTGMNVGKNSA